MIDKDIDTAIRHQSAMHTWASFALEHDDFMLTIPMLESIVKWTDEAIEIMEADDERVDQ